MINLYFISLLFICILVNNDYINITVQRSAGWSIYKEYNRWDDVIKLIKDSDQNYKFFQIGGPNDEPLLNVDGTFLGKTLLERQNAKLLFKEDKNLGGASVVISWSPKNILL